MMNWKKYHYNELNNDIFVASVLDFFYVTSLSSKQMIASFYHQYYIM